MMLPLRRLFPAVAIGLAAYVIYVALMTALPMVVAAGLLVVAIAGSSLALYPNPRAQNIGFAILAVAVGAALTVPLMVIALIVVIFLIFGAMR